MKELYNLRHASARNVVERIFGVIKARWSILTRPPHYNMHVQAKIPAALVALHNFILDHDTTDLDRWIVDEQAEDLLPGNRRAAPVDFGQLSTAQAISNTEKRRAGIKRDELAQTMWDDYEQYLADRMDVDDNYNNYIEPVDD